MVSVREGSDRRTPIAESVDKIYNVATAAPNFSHFDLCVGDFCVIVFSRTSANG